MNDAQNAPDPAATGEARTWALVAHLGPIALSLLSLGVLGWMVPLVVWLTRKQDSPFAAQHARESLNFRITLLIVYLACVPLFFVLWCFAIPLSLGIFVVEIVFGLLAAARASDGRPYRYPLTLRLVG